MLHTLPPKLSYSPLKVNVAPETSVTIHRRDLFDARFQLISSGVLDVEPSASEITPKDLEFVSAPSDLVPGVYEGGLKTWECSLDLIKYLHGSLGNDLDYTKEAFPSKGEAIRGKNVLDVGCGTALPSVYLLQEVFHAAPLESHQKKTVIHLQDYNQSVLELVTLPNIILAWYYSPSSETYRSTLPPLSLADDDRGNEFELELSPELFEAFTTSLTDHRIQLRFFTGSWSNLAEALPTIHETKPRQQSQSPFYDLVFTSETIYRVESLPSLMRLLRTATSSTSSQTFAPKTPGPLYDSLSSSSISQRSQCLVAAKLLYFGVGGGVDSFVQEAEQIGGKVQTVWEENEGLSRRIMRVEWP